MDLSSKQDDQKEPVIEANPAAARHHRFYCENITLKVEGTLFKVPRYKFQELSPVFADMFSLPSVGPVGTVEGQSDENPIVLEGYAMKDFERLLSILYPSGDAIAGDPICLESKEEWISVLKLSTAWEMTKARLIQVREMAIKRLSLLQVTPIEKIQLGREHRVSCWFLDGMKALATEISRDSEGGISVDSIAAQIGWEAAARVMSAVNNHKSASTLGERFIPSSGEVRVLLENIHCRRDRCLKDEKMRQNCPMNHDGLRKGGFLPGNRSFQIHRDENANRRSLHRVGGSGARTSVKDFISMSQDGCFIDWSLLKRQGYEAPLTDDISFDTIKSAFADELNSLT
ncbi:hypothetical protein CC1G_09269 [Coprinopsis cinerea okayama7|uniref:BTB domain-containing protein n=1 Tax=Coprinopsis cinerea (strain Okayama-7 / 130 / ATCC MYA-4618 / FGSC 9003) TaxID=240176 RepID=A8N848_COPC7|nr:hypothetical protein CC1G_09269 [Coprinopsis cinerea okayama7\|eukprot:XP_001831004.2 hypothetical protein CC1G_09269 [Coprinopsis cinerea okayama7\